MIRMLKRTLIVALLALCATTIEAGRSQKQAGAAPVAREARAPETLLDCDKSAPRGMIWCGTSQSEPSPTGGNWSSCDYCSR